MGWEHKPVPPLNPKEFDTPVAMRKLYRPLGEFAVQFADLEAEVTEALTNTILGKTWRETAAMEDLMQSFTARIELFYFLAKAVTGPSLLQVLLSAENHPPATAQLKARETLGTMADKLYVDLQQANSDRNNL